MSKNEDGSKHLYSHRTSIEQLLKCYGPDNSRRCQKTDPSCVSVINRAYSDSDTLNRFSISRHSEQRLRPRTCAACRACVTASLRNSVQEVATSTLLPLDQIHHLPYYSAMADKTRPRARHKAKAGDQVKPEPPTELPQLPHAKKLVSCNVRSRSGVHGSASSCSSNSGSRMSEAKMHSLPALPTLPQSGILLINSGCGSVHDKARGSDTELRKWIVEFGGDERAAFMARGLQKLQLAYEQGKAEMHQETENQTLPQKH